MKGAGKLEAEPAPITVTGRFCPAIELPHASQTQLGGHPRLLELGAPGSRPFFGRQPGRLGSAAASQTKASDNGWHPPAPPVPVHSPANGHAPASPQTRHILSKTSLTRIVIPNEVRDL